MVKWLTMEKDTKKRLSLLFLAVSVEGGMVVLSLFLAWIFGIPILDFILWGTEPFLWGLVGTVPLLLMFVWLLHWPFGPIRPIKSFLETEVLPLFRASPLVDLAIVSLLAGLGEELLFRGIIQEGLGLWVGDIGGLIITSILFGVAHMVTPGYAIIAGVVGLYLGWLWMATGNILIPIIAHAVYDFIALVLLLRTRWFVRSS